MHMLAILGRLAWRNLWRNHRRTIIMLAAISLGAWAMIFLTALTRGMVRDMIDAGISAMPGHVQVHDRNFLDDPSVANLIGLEDSAIAALFDGAGLEHWASRVRVPAVITSERESRGVSLLGIDPARERGLTFIRYEDVDGRFLTGTADTGIVIGRTLAQKLDTRLGKRVVVMTQNPENDIADRGFRIVGLFTADMQAFEESYAFAGKNTVQEMLGIGDRVSEIFVVGNDYRNVEPVYTEVAGLVGDSAEVLRWYEIDSYLGAMLDLMDGFVLIWIVVIFLALSFGLVNTLMMAVFERVREIGLMLALGMKPINILGQVIIESLLLLGLGLLIGSSLAWASVQPIRDGLDVSIVGEGMELWGMPRVLYPELLISDVILANVVVLVLGVLASLSPAWRASHYEPIEAITKA